MTRQEAKKLATSGVFKKTNFELLMKADYYSFVDQIFDEHEVQLKAKDEEIERLKEQYHQCLDDYIKCAERKDNQC